MFYYIFSLSGEWEDMDDLRVMDDRETALMFKKILNIPMRVLAK